jgi:ABC-type transport system involved in multi-copper enzyme maturation permease subunit
MNAFLRKELRLLGPSFLIGAMAALSVWIFRIERNAHGFGPMLRITIAFVVCPAMVVMLALESFGGEISAKTFSQLLTQSISRRRLWWTKVSLLAGAALALWAIWFFSLLGLAKIFGTNFFPADSSGMAIQSLLFLFAVFSGGLWTVLLFRQVGVAFWATILVPLALCVGTYSLLDDWDPHRANVLVAILFVLYGVLGFWFARWLFLRAQDVQWSGGVIAIPKWRSTPRVRAGAAAIRKYRPRMAVIKREFQLQQSQFIIAAFMAVLHLAAIALRNFAGLRGHEILQAVVHVFWILWLLTPVLIGCAAIAEERKLGTLEGQLCTPVSNRFQFLTKLGVVVLLSVIFGALMPTVLESLDGTRILGDAHVLTHGLLPNSDTSILWYWVLLAPIAVVSGLTAFYFSSLCRNTLQALGPSVLGIMAVGFVLGVSIFPEETIGYPLWRGFIGDLIGLPVFGCIALRLAYTNYRNLQRGLALWNRNVGGLLAAFVFSVASATGIYHRAWERVLPTAQKHGPARLDAFSRPEFQRQMGSLDITLPDGRVWQGNFGYSISSVIQMLAANWQLTELSGGSRFLDGTNWTSEADCLFDTVGIRKDGTLWISRKPLPIELNRIFGHSATWPIAQKVRSSAAAPSFEKWGDSKDWKSVVANGRYALLLKQDGTLWTSSTNGMSVTDWPGLAAFPLKQLGFASNWMELRKVSSQYIYARKKDGYVWSNVYTVPGADTIVSIDQFLMRSPSLDGHDWLGLAVVEYPSQDPGMRRLPAAGGLFNRYVVGIRDDGRFRLVASLPAGGRPDFIQRDVQLNPGTNWIGLEAFETGEAVLLKSDGSLWRWNLPPEENADNQGLTRVGTQSDWRAIGSDNADLLALSADGSIWAWRKDPQWQSVNDFSLPFLIQVSRRPQFVVNIFGKQE